MDDHSGDQAPAFEPALPLSTDEDCWIPLGTAATAVLARLVTNIDGKADERAPAVAGQ